LYVVVCRVLELIVLVSRSDGAKDLEIAPPARPAVNQP
jgi:hypothetical protein